LAGLLSEHSHGEHVNFFECSAEGKAKGQTSYFTKNQEDSNVSDV
jgi:hypothetical protein